MVGWLIGLVAELCLILATPCPAPLSMGFSRQEYWNGLPFPSRVALSKCLIQPTCMELLLQTMMVMAKRKQRPASGSYK